MVVHDDGNIGAGFPAYASREPWPVAYAGYSGEPVYYAADEFGEDQLGYDLPPTHWHSAWHDAHTCAYCGEAGELVADHIVPYAKGGAHLQGEFSWVDNRAFACVPCNTRKGKELGWRTRDGRSGFYWDGTPGGNAITPSLPDRSKRRR
ncbi:hypothetical protein GOD54_21365 [Sinorhizobium medicae]|nr:hypothetical protein [Sinorhizobium medicae]